MKKFMIAALAAGMLTACSDSAVVETPAGGGAQWGADGTGYVSLSINLPKTTSAGRTNDNDQFNDGNANEWAVNDAILVLFTQTGANEGDAEFQAAYQLPVNFNQSGSATDQITATAQITKRIQAISGNIKALVILNGISSGVFKCANGVAVDDKENASLKYIDKDGHEQDMEAGTTTFSDFQAYTSKISTDASKGLLMMNAPLTDAQSGTGALVFTGKTVSTLSEIIADNIKNTAAEAAAAPAANIYVERAVAKVTMSEANITGKVPGGTGSPRTLDYAIQGIALDNTNPTSYLVRNADLIDPAMMGLRSAASAVQDLSTGYRMVGNVTVGKSKPTAGIDMYRTYFATSTNYNGAATLDSETTIANYNSKWVTPATIAAKPLFCMENTFPVDKMVFDNTTRAILKVKIGDGTTHYIMHNWDNAGDTWCDEATMKGKVLSNIQAMAVYQGKAISDVKLKLTDSGVENVLVLESYKVNGDLTDSGDDFNTAKNRIGDVYKYENGIAYYEVRIQHFGDDLTPWNGVDTKKEWTTAPKEGTINTIYPDPQEQNYLGRYGVLRNNWYNLTVNSVKRIGTPFIPKVKNVDTPDDVINSYISVNINILSWAKREQGVDLQ